MNELSASVHVRILFPLWGDDLADGCGEVGVGGFTRKVGQSRIYS